jgi:Fe-Mn family superoxide dismutase
MMTRRELVEAMALTGATFAAVDAVAQPKGGTPAGPTAAPQTASPLPELPPAFAGRHVVAPLPFKAGALKGISEKLISSHHGNNYTAAVKNLNKVEAQLAQAGKEVPSFVVGGLMTSALTFRNSMIFHEHYFGNLGGDGKASGEIEHAISRQYGSLGRWEEHFRATGASLGGGSGWVVLGLDLHAGELRTFWSGNHTQAMAFTQPLLVMDMYEHAYQMDYGAAAAQYIDAFFQNVSWDAVNRRFEQGRRLVAALKG